MRVEGLGFTGSPREVPHASDLLGGKEVAHRAHFEEEFDEAGLHVVWAEVHFVEVVQNR